MKYASLLLRKIQPHCAATARCAPLIASSTRRPLLSLSQATTSNRSRPLSTNSESQDRQSREDSHQTNAPSSTVSSHLHQRVWEADKQPEGSHWKERIVDLAEEDQILTSIARQEEGGGRMRQKQQGVLHEDPVIDMRMLTQNYTSVSLASALRDREDALQQAAVLADEGRINELLQMLRIFHPRHVIERRAQRVPNVTQQLDKDALEWLRKTLMRMPRSVVSAHDKRAAVVLPLCTSNGVPCLLLEKRARHLRAHPDEVCLPGGMYCRIEDRNIVATCLREMREEIGGLLSTDHHPNSTNNHNNNHHNNYTGGAQVLGVFRCNWGEVHHLVGIAVTPVVVFLGELPEKLYPNPDEVAEIFTVSLEAIADSELWIHKDGHAPQFVGGPHPIWGLTGYILDRFRKDVLARKSFKPSKKKA